MKRKFRVVSCDCDQRCVSYSTLEAAEMGLRKMALNNEHYFVTLYNIDKPEDFDWYNPNEEYNVKCWHNYVACTTDMYFDNLPKEKWYAYVIVEFK